MNVTDEPGEAIKAGDTVQTKAKEESGYPPLKFYVDEVTELHGTKMACGNYGCISCELLEKVD